MALAHTPLDPATLSPDVRRVLAPGPARMMAARGLAPLPRPGDLAAVLYQLALDQDPAIRAAAGQSARELPDNVLIGALDDPGLDPRVLDYFAQQVAGRPAPMQCLLLNHATADQTIAELAARADEAETELIAQNEERLLRHPAIIGAMFHNARARMSTVDRAVELAARNQVEVPGIPGWSDMVNAVLLGKGRAADTPPPAEVDALFAEAVDGAEQEASQGNGSPDDLDAEADPDAQDEQEAAEEVDTSRDANPIAINRLTVPMKIRLATLGNSFARATLVRDPLRAVAMAAIKSPRVTDMEAAKYASNNSLSEDVIQYIAGRREWIRLYGIKLSLVQNPKTSIPAAMRIMPHLREKDLSIIAKSRNVPSAIAAQARKLMLARRQRGGGK